jgi:hypothetical protein
MKGQQWDMCITVGTMVKELAVMSQTSWEDQESPVEAVVGNIMGSQADGTVA